MDIQLLCFSQVFLEVVVCRVLYNNPAGVLIAFQERKIVGETWGTISGLGKSVIAFIP